jgi:hypothetical protein
MKNLLSTIIAISLALFVASCEKKEKEVLETEKAKVESTQNTTHTEKKDDVNKTDSKATVKTEETNQVVTTQIPVDSNNSGTVDDQNTDSSEKKDQDSNKN